MYKYFNKENIPSLNQVLDARENRVAFIHKLSDVYKKTVLSFKLNIPGEQKINPMLLDIFEIGIENIEKSIGYENILYRNKITPITGFEYFLVTSLEAKTLKLKMISLEESLYFGRLYDIDVYDKTDIISRKSLNKENRKCFLCHKDSKICARNRTHSLDQMLAWVENLYDNFK